MLQDHQTDKVYLRLTRSALERLIGHDTEMDILLSDATVKAVLEKHLKRVEKIIDDIAQECIGKDYSGRYQLSAAANSAISKWVNDLVNTTVGNYLRNNATEIQLAVLNAVEKQIQPAIESASKIGVDKALRKLKELI